MFSWLKRLFPKKELFRDDIETSFTFTNPMPTTKKPTAPANRIRKESDIPEKVRQTTTIKQTIIGNNNVQSAGSLQSYNKGMTDVNTPRPVRPPPPPAPPRATKVRPTGPVPASTPLVDTSKVDPFDLAVQNVLLHTMMHSSDPAPTCEPTSSSSYESSCDTGSSWGSSDSGSSGGDSGGGSCGCD